jgi:DNA-binding transcriptional ArsR family regulator
MTSLQDLIVSKVRVKMLQLFFRSPEEMLYVREITRLINEEINAVRRELERLLESGLIKSEQRGNRLYYSLNHRYLFYAELLQITTKSSGLGLKLRKLRRKLGTIDYVMFSGRYVRGLKPTRDEVDVLIIGEIVLPELEVLIKEEQEKLGRELNYAVFSLEEFEFRKARRDPFVMEILYGSRVMVIGDEDSFVLRQTPNV